MENRDLLAQLDKQERLTLIRLHKKHINQLDRYGPTNYLVQMIYGKLMGTDRPLETLSSWLEELEKTFLPISQTSWISAENPHLINFIWLMIINKRAAELFISYEKGQQLSPGFVRYLDNQAGFRANDIQERQDVIFSLIDLIGSKNEAQQLVERLKRSWDFVERLVPRVPWIENADSEQALYIGEALFRIKDKSLFLLKKEYLECFRIEEYNIAIYSVCAASIFPSPSEQLIRQSQEVVIKEKAAALKKHFAKVKKSFNQRLKRKLASKEHESVRFSYKHYEKLRLLSKFYKTTPKAFLNRLITQAYEYQIDVHQKFLRRGDRIIMDLHNLYDLTQPASNKYSKQVNQESSSTIATYSPRFGNKSSTQPGITDGYINTDKEHTTQRTESKDVDQSCQIDIEPATELVFPVIDDGADLTAHVLAREHNEDNVDKTEVSTQAELDAPTLKNNDKNF